MFYKVQWRGRQKKLYVEGPILEVRVLSCWKSISLATRESMKMTLTELRHTMASLEKRWVELYSLSMKFNREIERRVELQKMMCTIGT